MALYGCVDKDLRLCLDNGQALNCSHLINKGKRLRICGNLTKPQPCAHPSFYFNTLACRVCSKITKYTHWRNIMKAKYLALIITRTICTHRHLYLHIHTPTTTHTHSLICTVHNWQSSTQLYFIATALGWYWRSDNFQNVNTSQLHLDFHIAFQVICIHWIPWWHRPKEKKGTNPSFCKRHHNPKNIKED